MQDGRKKERQRRTEGASAQHQRYMRPVQRGELLWHPTGLPGALRWRGPHTVSQPRAPTLRSTGGGHHLAPPMTTPRLSYCRPPAHPGGWGMRSGRARAKAKKNCQGEEKPHPRIGQQCLLSYSKTSIVVCCLFSNLVLFG